MPLNPRLLRRLFAGGAIVAALLVAGFYIRNLLKTPRKVPGSSEKIPDTIIQRTKGFTFSQQEGGRTVYTIQAARFEQYKAGGRFALHDVSIIVYGRQGDRSDQIYGSDFEYDPGTGNVVSKGEVRIDLESESKVLPGHDRAPSREMKSLIHVKTTDLTFNRKSGLATTSQRIEFRIPEANGSAVGATYDSRSNDLMLKSAVTLVTTGQRKASITSQSAVITKDPRRLILQSARMEQDQRSTLADKVTVTLRDDDTIDRILGAGNIQLTQAGPKGYNLSAAEAEVVMGQRNQARTGTLFGGVTFERHGDSLAKGKAGRVLLDFGPDNRVSKAHGEDSVELTQGAAGKSQQIQAAAIDLFIENGKRLEKAVTLGPAEIQVTQAQSKTVITAGQFEGKFDARNHLKSVFGTPNTKVVSSNPGKPDRTATSRDVSAAFNDQGVISSVEQTGDFHYQEGPQTASADRAHYTVSDDNITLSGSPRVTDTGVTLTADEVQLNRKTGNATAHGNVKATFAESKAQPGGAMLASADPIHVTGTSMTSNRSTEIATFSNARLWQSADIIEGPIISFDRVHRSLQAQGNQSGQVHSVFVQPDKGKSIPVNVTADKLSYVDADRKAVYTHNVLVHSGQTTMNADTIQVFLRPRVDQGPETASQLDHIVALGEIQIDQNGRKATGNRVVYTAQEQKFVLTASEGKRPSIFDAEHGQISGDSLTFFSADDRVLVDSKESSHTVIQTRINDTSKK
ncbi:MAG TPA: LptA/OstA family protein [Verrucomicrobiae bacterium]|jgi:lipopolysaccharide export system protein LptA|nr:LptA/OstA family protein [Verrucomicrobiae bacterium]